MTVTHLIIAFLAAVAAGITNALAGGGTLISFPILTFIGLPAISANITNTIALCPGYLGGIYSQRKDFEIVKVQLFKILPFTILGGIFGGLLLLNTNESSFNTLIPYLIIFATSLIAFQSPMKKWLNNSKTAHQNSKIKRYGMTIALFVTAVYGGYFGAGISVIVFAVLSLVFDETANRINVLKQAISFSINISAAVYFCFSKQANWIVVLVMIVGSLLGGMIGGKIANKINPKTLRILVIIIGFTVSIIYFLKQ